MSDPALPLIGRLANPDRANPAPPGFVIWLTGLSGAGKTTLARALSQAARQQMVASHVIDGDEMRARLSPDLGFSAEDRSENIRRIGEVAAMFADAGLLTIVACISPLQVHRERVRACIGAERFMEIYLCPSLAACEKRDPKGLYRRARAGEIKGFTGIDAPYEAPVSADMGLDTDSLSVEECTQAIFTHARLSNIDCLHFS